MPIFYLSFQFYWFYLPKRFKGTVFAISSKYSTPIEIKPGVIMLPGKTELIVILYFASSTHAEWAKPV